MTNRDTQLARIRDAIALADHAADQAELAAHAEFLSRPAQPRSVDLFTHAANAGLITGGHPDSAGCCIALPRVPEGEK